MLEIQIHVVYESNHDLVIREVKSDRTGRKNPLRIAIGRTFTNHAKSYNILHFFMGEYTRVKFRVYDI